MSEKIRHTSYQSLPSFVTKDKSIIRELMHPGHHSVQNQSLAEAIVPVAATTLLHRHHQSEELYFITQGEGEMRLEDDVFAVKEGDSICIHPGTAHNIRNCGDVELKILCACAPAYSHEDTELL
jgi:mannose-6-phosphate isomerase-like protein (cupin superfamily)